jgi:hypothetical protein
MYWCRQIAGKRIARSRSRKRNAIKQQTNNVLSVNLTLFDRLFVRKISGQTKRMQLPDLA